MCKCGVLAKYKIPVRYIVWSKTVTPIRGKSSKQLSYEFVSTLDQYGLEVSLTFLMPSKDEEEKKNIFE